MTPQMTETNLVDLDINEISSQLKAFNTQPLITRKCVVALNSLMLLHTKEELKESHLNSFFTRILKSFQSKERYLKFMTHLVIQKIGKDCSDSFLSISSLLKDLTDKNYKESALKALFSVIPDQMLNDYKPVLMQGYVSRNEEVENISSCIYYSLLKKNMVNDWIVSPSSEKSLIKMALNFEIKKNDKNFLSSMLNNPLKDAKGVFVVKVGFFLYSKDKRKDEFIREALKLKFNQEMIFVEACKQLLNLEDEDILKFLTIALDSLKSLLKSKNTIIKFTSIKLLNQLAKKFPQHCEVLSEEVEELINDKNKNINIIATTTILLIGGEESASRLITKISNVFSTLSDSYKTFLVEAVTKLLKKFKSKKSEFVSFYKTALEEKSSFEFKVFLLKCIKEVMASNRESFLKLLSFYIEDSLNYKITILVLGILSEEIPMLLDEKISKNYLIDNFLIHIFNRLILENNHVRIAALECLTNISKYIDFIQTDVINLLNKYSKDDALKDISLFLLQTYEIKGEELSSTELKNLGIKREEVNKLIKECRIDLSERNSDLKVSLRKTIFTDFIDLTFFLENNLSGILIKEGVFSLAIFLQETKKEFEFSFDNLKVGNKREFNLKIQNYDLQIDSTNLQFNEVINVNSVIDYVLCPENDFSEVERETVSLDPFRITFMDYFIPSFAKNDLLFSSSSSFILDSVDLNDSLQRILKILNLQLITQNEENNEIKCVVEGNYDDNLIRVCVELWKKDTVQMNLDVFSNKEFLSESVIKLFE